MSNTITINVEAGSTVLIGATIPGVSDVQVNGASVEDFIGKDGGVSDDSGFRNSTKVNALFGAWTRAFGSGDDQHGRHLFTKAVLGDSITDPSWSRKGEITNDQADRLHTVLLVVADLT